MGCIGLNVSIGADILLEAAGDMAAVFLVEEMAIIAKPNTPRSRWTRWLGSVVIREGEDKFRVSGSVCGCEPCWLDG